MVGMPHPRHVSPPGDKVKRLAHKLVGTAGIECVEELSELQRHECRQLDMIAFACSKCDYWFNVTDGRNEINDLWYCNECAKEIRDGKG